MARPKTSSIEVKSSAAHLGFEAKQRCMLQMQAQLLYRPSLCASSTAEVTSIFLNMLAR